jgi:hypothetical protein
MIIVMFNDFSNNYWILKNPPQRVLNKIQHWNPNAIMKVYDFQTCEILTYVNTEFQWVLVLEEHNINLKGFKCSTTVTENWHELCKRINKEVSNDTEEETVNAA